LPGGALRHIYLRYFFHVDGVASRTYSGLACPILGKLHRGSLLANPKAERNMVADLMPISGSPFLLAARLCNFPTGKATLLPKHIEWIQGDVRRALASSPAPWVDVVGYASKLGDASSNMNLSGARCEAVKANVRQCHAGVKFNIEQHMGETESSGSEKDNDAYWRAADVYVYGFRPHVPVRPPPRPIPVVGSTQFEIRVVGGGSGSVIVQADNYFFQIVDSSQRLTAFFFYTGAGVGLSVPKIPGPGSITKAGPPTKFNTTRPVQLHAFNSRASLYQDPGATAGPLSVGGTMRLVLREVLDRLGIVGTRPSIIPVGGGPGIQMPGLGSASEGALALTSAVFPFTGYGA
jgi:hypothetical protein